ncbi:MAG: eukaryotic-like serine/threonine-protein kinase, partial [Nocardioidaceae bacterium]|nr:eukaryotic-like serine/threonine-protein kinase [Nocardioidaceae bacterium]
MSNHAVGHPADPVRGHPEAADQSPAPPPTPAHRPTVLNGRYELGEVVGSGGMGAVYRATDTRLGRTVAVKILRGGPLADDHARARMRTEANMAASVTHPGVAQVYDFDEGMTSPSDFTFIVMQYVEGHTLAQLLREQGPMAPEQVMSVLVQVAEGLQAAHEAGIVHRDLKPANIMLTPAGRTVLVDFGIARSATSEPLTLTGSLVGTADYLSPEQAAGHISTPASDLYSLGVVAYQCLTGTSPFRRESHVATALAHLNDELPALGPNVPSDVAQLITSLTAKNPSERPTSAAAVALQAAAIGAAVKIDLPTTFEMPLPDNPHVPPLDATTHVVSAPPQARGGRPRVLYAGIGLLVACLVFFGVREMHSTASPVIPNVVGMTTADATARIRHAGMTASPSTVDIAGKPAGRVFKQTPTSGKSGSKGDPIRIFIA